MGTHFQVRSAIDDGRVILWERSEEHPGGEVFVAGRTPVLSGMTRRVQELLHSGRLELVNLEPEEEQEQEEQGQEQEQEVSDVPPVADLPPAFAMSDDELLLAIDGISDVRLQVIKGLGVRSLSDLLAFDSAALADALPRVNLKMVADWKAQAQALASNPQP